MGQFNNFAEFLAMDGYAFYVWMSYGLAILSVVALVIYSRWARKKVVANIKRQQTVARYRQNKPQSEMHL
ncbi:heme exporter protein CcmD [Gayadomonas joobiniege]|uniref:heme exporter protein CcmD n=1 Tax=Gayadomonas joobiniege TaxID=1234606 RepID=UPI00036E8AAA|nr:heme exporter protein CcmD [Gayadomonas joobiniege]